MKRAITLASALTILGISGLAAQESLVTFTASKSPLVRLDANEAQGITNEINSILEETSSGGDVCDLVAFSFNGSITTIDRKESVDTAAELTALLNDHSSNVHVVSSINYCGGPAPAGVIGCAGRGTSIVVEDYAPDRMSAILWLHEFGHSQNLSRATDGVPHTDQPNAVMNATIGFRNVAVSLEECGYFAAHNPVFSASSAMVATSVSNVDSFMLPETPLEELLFTVWVHGVPAGEIREIGTAQNVANELRMIIVDSGKRHLWENAVTAMGIVGEVSDILFLQSFFSRQIEEPESEAFVERAKLQVPFAIGYISARFETSAGFNFLQSAINPSSTIGVFPGNIDRQEFLAVELSKSALMAIALSGGDNEAASAAIEEARMSNLSGLFDLGVDEEFFEGLQVISSQVSEMGLEQYVERTAIIE